MACDYVEQRNGGYYLLGSRVSLELVIFAYLRGESPEGIAESFPVLNMEQIFGALTFYFANREAVDIYLVRSQEEFEAQRQQSRRDNPAFYAKITEARTKAHALSR